jgi:hypothetical protein
MGMFDLIQNSGKPPAEMAADLDEHADQQTRAAAGRNDEGARKATTDAFWSRHTAGQLREQAAREAGR